MESIFISFLILHDKLFQVRVPKRKIIFWEIFIIFHVFRKFPLFVVRLLCDPLRVYFCFYACKLRHWIRLFRALSRAYTLFEKDICVSQERFITDHAYYYLLWDAQRFKLCFAGNRPSNGYMRVHYRFLRILYRTKILCLYVMPLDLTTFLLIIWMCL